MRKVPRQRQKLLLLINAYHPMRRRWLLHYKNDRRLTRLQKETCTELGVTELWSPLTGLTSNRPCIFRLFHVELFKGAGNLHFRLYSFIRLSYWYQFSFPFVIIGKVWHILPFTWLWGFVVVRSGIFCICCVLSGNKHDTWSLVGLW